MRNSGKEKSKKNSIEKIEEQASRGEDVAEYFDFKNAKAIEPIEKIERVRKDVQRVNVDFSTTMLNEIDEVSQEINVPRQSLIKVLLREALDRYHSMKKDRAS